MVKKLRLVRATQEVTELENLSSIDVLLKGEGFENTPPEINKQETRYHENDICVIELAVLKKKQTKEMNLKSFQWHFKIERNWTKYFHILFKYTHTLRMC